MKNIIIIAFAFLLSCETTSDLRNTESEYFVSALLVANEWIGESQFIFVGRTVSSDGSYLSEMVAEDVEVFIAEEDGEEFQLINTAELMSQLAPEEGAEIDTTFFKMAFMDSSFSPTIIKENTKYNLRIVIADTDTIRATTTTPAIVDIVQNEFIVFDSTQTFPEVYFDDLDDLAPIKINTHQNDETTRVKFRFYCLEEFSDSLEFAYLDFPAPEDEDDYENPLDGSPRKIEYFYEYTPTLEGDEYFITERGYQSTIVFLGRYEINARIIDENYYKYLYKPEGYRFGGIVGGIGYFGSVSGESFYTKVIK